MPFVRSIGRWTMTALVINCIAVQVGMHPRPLDALVLLGRLVRPLPIALRIPPQSGESESESDWRLGRGE